jgi:hypothetical protein
VPNDSDYTSENWKQNLQRHTETEIELNKLSQTVVHLTDRIPEKLSEKLIEMKLLLDQVSRDIKELQGDLLKDFVSRTEFEKLKVEHDQIKQLTYGFIVMVLLAVVGGVIALVVKG